MAAGPSDAVLVVGLPLGRRSTRMSVLAPTGHSQYARAAADAWRSADAETLAFTEDSSLRWHPNARAAQAAPRGGQGHASSRRSATRPPTSRTSRAATTGRSARPTPPAASAGSAATSTSTAAAEQPAPGPRARLQPRTVARHGQQPRGRRLRPRPVRRSPPPGVNSPDRRADARRRSAPSASLATSDPRPRSTRARPPRRAPSCARTWRASARSPCRPATRPNNTFARRMAGLAAMLSAGLPLKCVAIEASGGYDTHSDQEGEPARRHRRASRRRSTPSSATSSSAGRPTAC